MVRFDRLVEDKMRLGAPEKFAVQATMQEVVLCGLSDGGFFRHAAFYGGTCLRFFHGLDRFSEDLDFTSLDLPCERGLAGYFDAVARAFLAVGREVEVREVEKSVFTATASAFVKTETRAFQIGVRNAPKTTVKFEMDTNPPVAYPSETRFLRVPDPHAVVCCTTEGLFVGKVSACLFRAWRNRVKGRDWYDLVWYADRKVPLRADLLRRVTEASHPESAERMKDAAGVRALLRERVGQIDFDRAREDVYPFVERKRSLDLWGADFFRSVVDDLVIA